MNRYKIAFASLLTFYSLAALAAPFAYLTQQAPTATVTPVDLATNTVGAPIPIVGGDPFDIAINPAGTLAYVTNAGPDTVTVIRSHPEFAFPLLPYLISAVRCLVFKC